MAINTRSPHYVSINTASYSALLNITIWTGQESSPPSVNDYQLKKIRLGSSSSVTFEISELIRDFIEITFDGNYTGQAVWVQTVITGNSLAGGVVDGPFTATNLALDSYSYFQEPTFNVSDSPIMISNRKIFVLADNIFRIPVYTGLSPTVTFIKDGEIILTQTFTSSVQSSEQIKYISINGTTNDYDSFRSRVLGDGGVFENSTCLQDFFEDFEIGEVDSVVISYSNKTESIEIITLEECKYTPKKVTFINKFGALQDMIFFKKSVEVMNIKKESYKANIISSTGTYSTSNHVNRDFNVMGKESITLSSGYLNEEYNEVFKQLLLSEKVWLTNVTETQVQVLPINVKTSDITYKTSLNNKLVEYTIEFDNSYDTINNIR